MAQEQLSAVPHQLLHALVHTTEVLTEAAVHSTRMEIQEAHIQEVEVQVVVVVVVVVVAVEVAVAQAAQAVVDDNSSVSINVID